MTLMEFWRHYLISGLGIASLAISAGAGAWAGLSFGILAGAGAGLGSFAALATFALASGLGQKAAARERERLDRERNLEALEEPRAARDRLASLRVGDPEVARLVQLAVLRASSYLGASELLGSRDPRADLALTECLELVDLYLKELDGASTERRFGLEDGDPFADARGRVGAALSERIAILERAALDSSGGLKGSERMSIKEELR